MNHCPSLIAAAPSRAHLLAFFPEMEDRPDPCAVRPQVNRTAVQAKIQKLSRTLHVGQAQAAMASPYSRNPGG